MCGKDSAATIRHRNSRIGRTDGPCSHVHVLGRRVIGKCEFSMLQPHLAVHSASDSSTHLHGRRRHAGPVVSSGLPGDHVANSYSLRFLGG